jgi:pimeloyl-ACP methyl ester carboxylesterase
MQRLLILFLIFLAANAQAATVQQTLPNRLVALAEYRKGQADKPAILLLHGFLQTNEFPTIYRLTGSLADAGYTVLAPNLSLGVTHRRQSLACEAIHNHTLQDELGEIATWVKWLKNHHAGPIVLLGHSFCSIELLAYLADHPDPAIRQFIGVSIVESRLKLSPSERRKLVEELRQEAKKAQPRLVSRQFSFCNKFQATPKSLLSYMEWTPQKVLEVAAALPLPNLFIMGGHDDRLGPGWVEQLKKRNRVEVFAGANHFMDGEHEFDLVDAILKELGKP